MEIEHTNTIGVLHEASITEISEIAHQSINRQGYFYCPDFQSDSIRISLASDKFIVSLLPNAQESHKHVFYVTLRFELKFQILYAEPDNPCSKKLGFKLYETIDKQNDFYCEDPITIDAFLGSLSEKLNQKGFHQQFKPVLKIGKGNFASVYEVIRLTDKQRFAVKAFSKLNTYSSQHGKQSLINELQVLRQLSHENILHLEAVYESDNSIYVVLELLTGKTLYQLIKQKKGVFSTSEIKQIMYGLLKGLKSMSGARILHRDLKPENIMLRNGNCTFYSPVIVDFGLSTNCDIDKYLFYRCGTPGFVAPEIIRITQHTKIEPQCDIFSIGCIFHVLLSGFPIFPGVQYSEVYQKNKKLQFNIKAEYIQNNHSDALNLLNQLIIEDPLYRIKAKDALNHPFFAGMAPELDEPETQKQNMETLTNITRRRTAISD